MEATKLRTRKAAMKVIKELLDCDSCSSKDACFRGECSLCAEGIVGVNTFVAGVAWARKHKGPRIKWHNADEAPCSWRSIVYKGYFSADVAAPYALRGKYGTWDAAVRELKIKKWCYASDISEL